MEHLYFAPHQDDELTNLGPEICRALSEGHRVTVVLCTDGGASGVRRMLCDGGDCAWHAGPHIYTLTAGQFVAARDTEFSASCAALGVPEGEIVISPLRAPDGSLTVQAAKAIMLEALRGRDPANCLVCTLAPMPERGQNPDHTAVGQAALELFREGAFGALRLTQEFILLPPEGPPAGARVTVPAPEELAKIKAAAECYRLWAPRRGRWAVGYHSVADEFNDFLKNPVCVEA